MIQDLGCTRLRVPGSEYSDRVALGAAERAVPPVEDAGPDVGVRPLTWHAGYSQGQILALAFRLTSFKRFVPACSFFCTGHVLCVYKMQMKSRFWVYLGDVALRAEEAAVAAVEAVGRSLGMRPLTWPT